MGIIYQVRDESDGKLAALKLMHAAAADDVTRFFREAQLLSTIHHPGIVSYIAHGTDDSGSPYLVMEWLDGEDLSRRLARGVLSFRETVTLFRELSSAVSLIPYTVDVEAFTNATSYVLDWGCGIRPLVKPGVKA